MVRVCPPPRSLLASRCHQRSSPVSFQISNAIELSTQDNYKLTVVNDVCSVKIMIVFLQSELCFCQSLKMVNNFFQKQGNWNNISRSEKATFLTTTKMENFQQTAIFMVLNFHIFEFFAIWPQPLQLFFLQTTEETP